MRKPIKGKMTLERRTTISKKDKEKSHLARDTILAALLFAGMTILGAMSYTRHNPFASKEPIPEPTPIKKEIKYDLANLDNWEIPSRWDTSLRDLFVAPIPIKPKEVYKGPMLNGIVSSEDKPAGALIGEKIYHKGDKVGEYTIIKIDNNYIEIKKKCAETLKKTLKQTID